MLPHLHPDHPPPLRLRHGLFQPRQQPLELLALSLRFAAWRATCALLRTHHRGAGNTELVVLRHLRAT